MTDTHLAHTPGPTAALTIFAAGTPAPQGSKRCLPGRSYPIDTNSAKLKKWRTAVHNAALNARAAHPGLYPITTHVAVSIEFRFDRPRNQYRTGRFANVLRDDAPRFVTSHGKGDLDKLIRSTLDALTTSGVWRDDSLVAELASVRKVWTENPAHVGAYIVVAPLEDHQPPDQPAPPAAAAAPAAAPANPSLFDDPFDI